MASSIFTYQWDWNWSPMSVWPDKSSLCWFGISICYIARAYNWPISDSRSRFYQNDWLTNWFFNIAAYSKQDTGSPGRSSSQKINWKPNIQKRKRLFILSLSLSLSLPQSGVWFSAALITARGLYLLPNGFRAAVKHRLGAPMYEKRTCPYCKTGSSVHLVIMLLHVMGGAIWFRDTTG